MFFVLDFLAALKYNHKYSEAVKTFASPAGKSQKGQIMNEMTHEEFNLIYEMILETIRNCKDKEEALQKLIELRDRAQKK